MYSLLVVNSPKTHTTYRKIYDRLLNCGIKLEKYMAGELKVFESSLDGIIFKLKKGAPMDMSFENALNQSRKYRNPAFRSKKLNDEHWPFLASLGATNGVGFREIQYPFLSDRDITSKLIKYDKSLNVSGLDMPFSAQFGDPLLSMDSPSLHCAIDYSGEYCGIHIDQTGFLIGGLDIDVTLTPEFIRHTLVELFWKDVLKVPKGIELVTPSASNGYDRFGLRAEFSIDSKKKIAVEQSCSIHSGLGCAVTMSMLGLF